MKHKKAYIRLIVDVEYDLNEVKPLTLQGKLISLVEHASGEGLFTGETEAEVAMMEATTSVIWVKE